MPWEQTPDWRFNPRPCARGDKAKLAVYDDEHQFQSTPLREGRRYAAFDRQREGRVSIHAPARGATLVRPDIAYDLVVSIHAPARGATNSVFIRPACAKFQSTPLREGRHGTS